MGKIKGFLFAVRHREILMTDLGLNLSNKAQSILAQYLHTLYWNFGYRNQKVPKALIDFSPIENKGIVNEKPPKPIRIGMKAFLL